MITIGKPNVKTKNGLSRLESEIRIDGETSILWVDVDEEYGQFLCHERCDAFVLGLLHYAMKYGHDITCETPMTDRLYEQLTEQFLPAFAKVNGLKCVDEGAGSAVPKIYAPLATEVEHPKDGEAIGTGCSCGVDSMHVYASHPEITHGCVWNVHGETIDETEEKRAIGFKNLITQAKKFTGEVGVKLLIANSNYDRGCYKDLKFDGSISFGNLFFIFALQKLWKKYYVASGYDITEFHLDCGLNADPAHYEYLMFAFCCLGRISVAIDGVAQTRIQKVADLVRFPPSKKYLTVCWDINENGTNCSCGCAKCMRTMLELYALGCLDDYSAVFDVAYYREHPHEYLAEFYRGCINKDDYALELKPYLKEKRIPFCVRMAAVWIVMKKVVKKILRGGRIRKGKFSARG